MIKEYIQFAIDNFDNRNGELVLGGINKIEYIDHNGLLHYESIGYGTGEDAPTGLWIPLHTLITSKTFIEAVARGINPTYEIGTPGLDGQIDWITTQQAIAIRDGDLSTFITNLLGNQK